MQLNTCIKKRRSIRSFKDKDVSKEKIQTIINYALHAPSAKNMQNWRFIIVRKKEIIKKLSQIHSYCSFITQAPVVIMACSDQTNCTYKPSDILSVAAAIENLLLGVTEQGLAACWTFVKDYEKEEVEKKAKKILDVPDQIDILAMIPVGYPNQQPKPKKVHKLSKVVHYNKWK
jgi:nitroreductase